MADPAPKVRFRDARNALTALHADPERSELVFEIVGALSGRQPQRLLARVARDPDGARLLHERPHFDSTRERLEALERLPDGSFGRVFAAWMRENAFEPGFADRGFAGDDDTAYIGRRMASVHDLWHVLSGYNRDPLGELGVLAFSVGQFPTRGFVLILLDVLWRHLQGRWRDERRIGGPLFGYLWRGWRAGRRARFLPAVMLEDHFAEPLPAVRARLGVAPLERPMNDLALPPIASPLAPA